MNVICMMVSFDFISYFVVVFSLVNSIIVLVNSSIFVRFFVGFIV